MALDFHLADPTDLQLAIVTSSRFGMCGLSPGTAIYTFQAFGDLDGDGVRSTIELAAGSDDVNDLYRRPGIYVVDPME